MEPLKLSLYEKAVLPARNNVNDIHVSVCEYYY